MVPRASTSQPAEELEERALDREGLLEKRQVAALLEHDQRGVRQAPGEVALMSRRVESIESTGEDEDRKRQPGERVAKIQAAHLGAEREAELVAGDRQRHVLRYLHDHLGDGRRIVEVGEHEGRWKELEQLRV